MDPILVGVFLKWASTHPEDVRALVERATATRKVDAAQMASFADMSQQVLKCYHPTARFKSADVVESPWSRQKQYGADSSTLISMRFVGLSKKEYEMQVGLLEKNGQIKTTVVKENTLMRASARCQLEQWTKTK